MPITYDQHSDERHGFALPTAGLRGGRNTRKAFEHGFDSYVWTNPIGRTNDGRDLQANYRYSRPGLRLAFKRGWDAAADIEARKAWVK